MKRIITLSLFGILLFSAAAYAVPDRTAKWDAGVNVSGAIPDDSESDSTAYVGGNLSYGVNNWFALGFSGGWAQFDDSDAGIELEETAVPLFGDIILRVPSDQPAQLYGVIGLGAIIWDVDDNIATVEADVDEAFAAKFGVGVDWFVNDNWIVNVEAAYVMSDADATVRNTVTGASLSAEGETDFWLVGGGLKYLFS